MDRRDFARATVASIGMVTAAPRLSLRPASQDERIIVDGLDTSVVNEGFLGLLATGGVDCVHKSMGDIASYAPLYAFLHRHREQVVPALTVREIREAKRQGKRSMIFGVQHANFLESLVPKTPLGSFETIAAGLKGYYDVGLRIHGICYNVANIFGGGCLDPGVPLTRAGKWLVEQIHKNRILLDVGGHTGEQTSLDAIALSSGVPIVCTHTNVAALNPNPRATSDRLLEAIARTGGVVGVTAISDFHVRSRNTYQAHGPVSPQASLEVHLDQYDYLKKLIGVDHVGLGPDFVWGWGETFDSNPETSVTFPPEALSDGPAITVKDYENISKLPNLRAGLTRRGWTAGDIDKVFGGNWLRVYEKAWGA
jgi:membrane dipeptidase